MSPWHADAIGAGLAKPDQGEKQETNGGKLAFLRAVQAFPCHGGRWAAGGQGHSQFNSIDFHAKTGSLVLSWLKKVPSLLVSLILPPVPTQSSSRMPHC